MAFSQWARDGKPLNPAQPIRDLVDRLKLAYPKAARANLFSWYADSAHYQAAFPEDHTPYSSTGWPGESPYPWVFATDIMHRVDLGVDCNLLFGYWLQEARADRMPWLKYMNWQGKQYRAKGYGGETRAFQRAYANSGHWDHIHLSARTDYRDTGLGSWSPIPGATPATPPTPPPAAARDEDDMDPQVLHDLVHTVLGTAGGDLEIVIPHMEGGAPERRIPNKIAQAVAAQSTAITALAAAVAAVGTNSPEVAGMLEAVQAALDAQTAALQQSTTDAVAALGEGGAAEVRRHAPAAPS